jgi:hypothetical protein
MGAQIFDKSEHRSRLPFEVEIGDNVKMNKAALLRHKLVIGDGGVFVSNGPWAMVGAGSLATRMDGNYA